MIASNGKVIWVPIVTLPVRCAGSVTWWPREELTCKLILGSWTYSEKEINLQIREGEIEVRKVHKETRKSTNYLLSRTGFIY